METTDLLLLYKTEYGERGEILHTYSAEYGFQVLRSYELNTRTLPMARGEVHVLALVTASYELPRPPYQMGVLRRIEKLYSHHKIQSDLIRKSISLFMCEILEYTLRRTTGEAAMLQFIKNSLHVLNEAPSTDLIYFIHRFLLMLSARLGFCPQGEYSITTPVFNLQTGCFQSAPMLYTELILSDRYAAVLSALLKDEKIERETLNRNERNRLLAALIRYLEIHTELKLTIKSLPILQQILHS